MADFRRSISVLALVALMLGAAVTASAQTAAFQCVANAAVPTLVRSEGLTELVGDLVLNCTGGNPTPVGAAVPAVNIQIFLNTAVTSDLLESPWSEALLLLDEPSAGNQFPCRTASGVCTNIGTGTGAGNYGTEGNKNVFQGQQAGSNSILWLGVPIDAPGSNTRVIRITNVRANANALGVAGGNSAPTPIIMTVSATGQTSVPINNPQQTVAFVLKGLSFSVLEGDNGDALTAPIGSLQCISRDGLRIATLRFSELFATAFKKRTAAANYNNPAGIQNQNGPGVIYNTESGFVNRGWAGNSARGTLADAGLAQFGTRLKAVFNNVPAGVTLYVDQTACEYVISATNLARVCLGRSLTSSDVPTIDAARATDSETGDFDASDASDADEVPTGVVQVALTSGSGSVVWEVVESHAQTLTELSFGLYATYSANPGATGGGSPALGTGTVNGSFAPVSTVGVAAADPIPRFADTSTSTSFLTIVVCRTILLFPFVTNQVGFDTGLAIAATATDPFGTAPQGGTCTLNWYGANAPAATVTPTVASGTVYTTLASTAAPNFQGYMIAVCRFQFGHGFSFVSDLGATRLAMGYLALVIPDPTGSDGTRLAAVPVGGSPTGEQLAQ